MTKKTMYVVIRYTDQADEAITGVFSSREAAQAKIDQLTTSGPWPGYFGDKSDYFIQTWAVDPTN